MPRSGDIPPADRAYLHQLVAARAGISPAGAQKRVDDVISKAKEAEVKVRQAADGMQGGGDGCVFHRVFDADRPVYRGARGDDRRDETLAYRAAQR